MLNWISKTAKKQSGVTLISVLVGLAISSGLTLSLSQTFIMAKQSYQLATELNDFYSRAELAMELTETFLSRAGEGAFQQGASTGGSLSYAISPWISGDPGGGGDCIGTNLKPQTSSYIDLMGTSWTPSQQPHGIIAVYKSTPTAFTTLQNPEPHTLVTAEVTTQVGSSYTQAATLVPGVEFISHLVGEMDHNAGVSRWIQNNTNQSNGQNLDFNRIIAVKVAYAVRSKNEILPKVGNNLPLVLFQRDGTNDVYTGQLCYCPDAGYHTCGTACSSPSIADRRLRKVFTRTFYLKAYNPPKRPPWCTVTGHQGGGAWIIKTGGVYSVTNGYTNNTFESTTYNVVNRPAANVEILSWGTNGADRCCLRYTGQNSLTGSALTQINVKPAPNWTPTTFTDGQPNYYCRTWGNNTACSSALSAMQPANGAPPVNGTPLIPGCGNSYQNLY